MPLLKPDNASWFDSSSGAACLVWLIWLCGLAMIVIGSQGLAQGYASTALLALVIAGAIIKMLGITLICIRRSRRHHLEKEGLLSSGKSAFISTDIEPGARVQQGFIPSAWDDTGYQVNSGDSRAYQTLPSVSGFFYTNGYVVGPACSPVRPPTRLHSHGIPLSAHVQGLASSPYSPTAPTQARAVEHSSRYIKEMTTCFELSISPGSSLASSLNKERHMRLGSNKLYLSLD